MKTKLQIVKIGGNIIDNEQVLDVFLSDFSQLTTPKILIHGGGKLASNLSDQLGIKTIMNEGRRITSNKDLDVVTMVYAGLINKKVCAHLQGKGCNSIGLSGADANSILAVKRAEKPINYGWVGDIKKVNANLIHLFLSNNMTPVFSAICHDGNGQLLNTNADTIASEIAIAMSDEYETELIYCFDKQGVLANVNDSNSIIKHINKKSYQELKINKTIHEGMLPKMENCFHALSNNVSKVIIGNAQVINNNKEVYTSLTL